jgi:hypothetical protein
MSRGPTEMAGRGPEEHFQRRRPLPGIDGKEKYEGEERVD